MKARAHLRRPALRAAALLCAGVLSAGCTAAGEQSESPGQAPSESVAAAPTPGTTGSGAVTGGLEDVPRIAAAVQPSVVTVLVNGGNGSGVIYSEDGLILTNEHVVRGNSRVQISFADGQRAAGTVEAVDAVTDLALIRTERTGLPAAEFQTVLPRIGSLAVVIGSPLGFQNTVTAGVISGLHREIPGSASQGQSLVDLMQTDAPISPGNSGGAVVDAEGHVIGISEAYIPPQAGAVALGFAIPAATAVDVAEQLREDGRASHAFVGLVPSPITPEIAEQLGVQTTDGFIVVQIVENGPADEAGLRPGDVITAVEGEPTPTPEDFLAVLRQHDPGDAVTFTVVSPGEESRDLKVTVTDRPR
jgi:serine protease DegQ